MEILVTRNWKRASYTIGRMYIDGKMICNTLEDTDRGLTSDMAEEEILRVKVYARTAIPTGRYRVRCTWSPKFKQTLPEVFSVKGFSGIRIHAGNTAQDTAGCILVGRNTAVGRLTRSRAALRTVIAAIKRAKDEVWLTVK